jgi:hypothetical protein
MAEVNRTQAEENQKVFDDFRAMIAEAKLSPKMGKQPRPHFSRMDLNQA